MSRWSFALLFVLGACSSTPAPTAPTAEADTCELRLENATRAWQSVREANLTCADDSECTLLFPNTGCRGACQVAVNTAGAPTLEQAVTDADAAFCTTFRDDGCPYATPRCALGVPFCNAGTCDARYP